MLSSRTLVAIACTAGLVAVPGTAVGAKKPKDARSHLVKTPRGSQLAVPVSVRYGLDTKKSLKRSSLTTRLALAAKLPGGRVLRAAETRSVPGRARVRVEHHPFFSVRQTRVLRRPLGTGQTVKLAVASSLSADLDGDGDTDARSKQNSTQVLARPSSPRALAPIKHQQGNDPCGVLGLPSTACANTTGATFTARHFWASSTVNITCPSAFPYPADSVSTATTSKRYTQTVLYPAGPTDTSVLITDDNPTGHPYAYTPTAACAATDLGL